jgi:hypothetical protein
MLIVFAKSRDLTGQHEDISEFQMIFKACLMESLGIQYRYHSNHEYQNMHLKNKTVHENGQNEP